jgi:uncharacterized protein YdaU (DUF1376 family)
MTDTVDVSISMPWHTGDWYRETAHMLLDEKGAHADSLTAAWIHGGYLRRDRWRQQAHVDPERWPAIELTLLDNLWTVTDDGRVCLPRLLTELERARVAKAKAIERGRAGGQAPHPTQRREGVESKPRTSRDEGRDGTEHPSPSPPPSPDEPTPKPKPSDPEEGTEAPADGRSAPAAEVSLLDFSCRGKVKAWSLTEPHRAQLAEAFPDLDIVGEAKKAKAWIAANPTRTPTARGMTAFFYRWVARTQDGGPRGRQAPAARDPRIGQARAEDSKHDQIGDLEI